MARQKKDDAATGELQVSIEQFTRTRDSVIMSLTNLQAGLTHVQNGLAELLRAYMQHTASILAGGGDAVENLQLPPHLAAHAHAAIEATQSAGNAITAAVAANAATDGKKKRKRAEKKEKDPNAPPRPLTAYFLFAEQARPIVRRDLQEALGPDQKLEANAVNLEVQKRWSEMAAEEKEKWKASYRDSYEKWKEAIAEYVMAKGDGAQLDVEMHDDEEPTDEAEVGALDSDGSTDSEDEADAPSPAAKAPTPPVANVKTPRANKRQKISQAPHANGTAGPVPIAPAVTAQTPVPIPIPTSKQTQIPPPSSAVELPANSSPVKEKKDKKKKEKPAPQPIAPAPAANKEPSPDDNKKKNKSGRSTRNTEAEADSPAADKEPKKKRDRSKRKSEGGAA